MLKLGSAIARWAPSGQKAAADPLSLLAAGWEEIVGAEVAANSAPVRISDGTLAIVTRSSAWSHQLSFLADHVLGAVAARLAGAHGVERLRFRVSALPKRSAAPAARHVTGSARRLDPRPSPATAAAALRRFRSDVEARQKAKRSAGWTACGACAALIAPTEHELCPACDAARDEERALATARLLFEAPWLGFRGTSELVDGLSEKEYERVRRRLLKRWWGMLEQARAAGRLSRDGRERLIANSYVVLRSKLAPEDIMPATVRNVLGEELHDLLYGQAHPPPVTTQRKQNERRT